METVSRQTNHINSLDPWFVTGFVEGEGSFTYSRNGDCYALYFAIKLTAIDKQILVDIQEFFGVGKIYDVKAIPPRMYSGKTKASKYYRVTRLDDLWRIIKHFDEYTLRGSKADSYCVWREIVVEKSKLRGASKEKIQLLAEKLSRQSPRNQV